MVCLGSFSLKCVEHNTGGSNDELGEDFKWHADTTLNNNEVLGTEKDIRLVIPFYPCPGESLSWLVGC